MSDGGTTKRAIEDALLRLMAGRPYRDITAAAVAKEAGLSRQGFYLHFKDKDDVLVSFFLRLFREIMASVEEKQVSTIGELVATYTSEVRGRQDTLRLLAENDLGLHLGSAFIRELTARPPVLPIQREPGSPAARHFFNTFWVTAFIAVYTQWLSEGMRTPDAELNRILTDIMTGDYFQENL